MGVLNLSKVVKSLIVFILVYGAPSFKAYAQDNTGLSAFLNCEVIQTGTYQFYTKSGVRIRPASQNSNWSQSISQGMQPSSVASEWKIKDWKCAVPNTSISDLATQIRIQNERMISEYTDQLRSETEALRRSFLQTFALQLDIISAQMGDIKSSISGIPTDLGNADEIKGKIEQLSVRLENLKSQLDNQN